MIILFLWWQMLLTHAPFKRVFFKHAPFRVINTMLANLHLAGQLSEVCGRAFRCCGLGSDISVGDELIRRGRCGFRYSDILPAWTICSDEERGYQVGRVTCLHLVRDMSKQAWSRAPDEWARQRNTPPATFAILTIRYGWS